MMASMSLFKLRAGQAQHRCIINVKGWKAGPHQTENTHLVLEVGVLRMALNHRGQGLLFSASVPFGLPSTLIMHLVHPYACGVPKIISFALARNLKVTA
jgi:hypothetical protein